MKDKSITELLKAGDLIYPFQEEYPNLFFTTKLVVELGVVHGIYPGEQATKEEKEMVIDLLEHVAHWAVERMCLEINEKSKVWKEINMLGFSVSFFPDPIIMRRNEEGGATLSMLYEN